MNRNTVEHVLNFLEDNFDGKRDVLTSIAIIRNNLDSITFSAGKVTLSGEFTIPKEVDKAHKDFYLLFSDGACRGNPGPGAWGVLAQDKNGDVILESNGLEVTTTNNQMELEGAIQALKWLNEYMEESGISPSVPVYLFSDSKYVIEGLNSWIDGWKKRGWKKADKKEPENLDYWQRLDAARSSYQNLICLWVKGHAGHPQNEHCDKMANLALDESGF